METLYNSIMRFQLTTSRTAAIPVERSTAVLLLFVAVCVAAWGTACGGKASQSRSSSPTSTSASDSSGLSPPSKSLPKIVAFGDSLTAGFGLRQSESYPALLQKKLDADGFKYEVVNAGVSGETSAGGLRRIDWALEGGVKIVIVELGGNDILRGQPIPAMTRNLGEIIERAKSKGAAVLLAGMEAPTNTGADYRNEVHAAFQDMAREHRVALIPFLLDKVAGVDSLNQADGIHPNAEGAKMVVETVYRFLRPLIKQE